MSEKKTLKDYMEKSKEVEQTVSEKEIFNSLELNENELRALKSTIISKDLTIPALVNLVLREKNGNIIKEENKEELLIRGFINESGNITEEGKLHIESDEIKEKLNRLLNEQ